MANLLFSFRGRINRAKFWLIVLGILVVELVLFTVLGGNAAQLAEPQEVFDSLGWAGGAVLSIFFAIVAWVSLAIGVKRFHDRDKTGWWVLIALVPLIGPLWYLVEVGLLRGTDGHNVYGSDPLARY